MDSEPAPAGLSRRSPEEDGFGIFSFRTGNIYTAALFRQWIELSLSLRPDIEEVYEEDGRFFDPLRPNIPSQGFATLEEFKDARRHTFSCIRKSLEDADYLIFTLGLTECWRNNSGFVYPMCPGTLRGRFDAEKVAFHNQTSADVLGDLTAAFDCIRTVNPEIRFILTVSPVPLTATASAEHVLTATVHSKSILRSVAGELKNTRDDVDYFPSYELISSAATGGRFYDTNLRTVTKTGVAFVMAHFQEGLEGTGAETAHPATSKPSPPASSSNEEADALLCEEALLETWAPSAPEIPPGNLCLIGDSHMGHLAESFTRLGIPNSGGGIMTGSSWTSNLLHLDSDEIFVPLESAEARVRWQQTLPFFKSPDTQNKIILTNIAQQTHRSVVFFVQWAQQNGIQDINNQIFFKYFLEENKTKLSLLKRLTSEGYKVILVSDPPLQHLAANANISFWVMYEKLSERIYKDLGCDVFSARDFIEKIGYDVDFASEKYSSGITSDWFHGSRKYYDTIAKHLSEIYELSGTPPSSADQS